MVTMKGKEISLLAENKELQSQLAEQKTLLANEIEKIESLWEKETYEIEKDKAEL